MTEITQHYWGFWNYGATSGKDLIWSNDVVKPYLGYFWTDKKRLKVVNRVGSVLIQFAMSMITTCREFSRESVGVFMSLVMEVSR